VYRNVQSFAALGEQRVRATRRERRQRGRDHPVEEWVVVTGRNAEFPFGGLVVRPERLVGERPVARESVPRVHLEVFRMHARGEATPVERRPADAFHPLVVQRVVDRSGGDEPVAFPADVPHLG
jgi:hypothetical protein